MDRCGRWVYVDDVIVPPHTGHAVLFDRCVGLSMYLLWSFFFSSRRRHTRSLCDWSSDVCSSDLPAGGGPARVLKSLNWIYPRKMDFSPDGRYIVYDESGNEDAPTSSLRVLAADGSRETALVNDAEIGRASCRERV